MFASITPERVAAMTDRERRWFDNIKKAFFASDQAYAADEPEDRCMEELCKAIDTAKTLQRSLRGEDTSGTQNKKRFLEFLSTELPAPDAGGWDIHLLDARTNKPVQYSFASLIYTIRCMVHENENLNAAEAPDYHIVLDWSMDPSSYIGIREDGRLTCNAHAVWQRTRQVTAKFITGLDTMIAMEAGLGGTCTGNPPLCSIKPDEQT